MSVDGSVLATGSEDRTARLWSTKTELCECIGILKVSITTYVFNYRSGTFAYYRVLYIYIFFLLSCNKIVLNISPKFCNELLSDFLCSRNLSIDQFLFSPNKVLFLIGFCNFCKVNYLLILKNWNTA